jgi:hypothetical protein
MATIGLCAAMFWQPQMDKDWKKPVATDSRAEDDYVSPTSIHWLRHLRIELPEGLESRLEDSSGIRIGYRDLDGIYLGLIPEKGGSYEIIASIKLDSKSSAAYSRACREIAYDPGLIRTCLEYYLGE